MISHFSYVPQWGTKPITQAHALTENQNGNLSLCRMTLEPLKHTAQDKISISVSRLVSLYDLQETFSDMEFSDQTGILTLIDNAKLPSGNITSINSTMSV